jgi:hypothetical protein
MNKTRINLKSNISLILYDEVGNIKNNIQVHNIVPTVGLASIMEQLLATSAIETPTHMELGTGIPTATKLGSYIPDSRTALSSKTRSGVVLTMGCTFGPGIGTGSVIEAGIFNTATQNSGDMYASASFDIIPKGVSDSLEVVWTMTATSV